MVATPWECEDASNAIALFVGPLTLCKTFAVARSWSWKACDPTLWAQLLPGATLHSADGSLGSQALARPVQTVLEGKSVAKAEFGGKKHVVAMLDLLGDWLALCEGLSEEDGRSPSQAVEVHNLKTGQMHRYEAAVHRASAMRLLDDGTHLLLAGEWRPQPANIINLQHSPEQAAVLAAETRGAQGLPDSRFDTMPLTWLARAGGSRAVGCQALWPCVLWLFDVSLSSLRILVRVSIGLPHPTILQTTKTVWEVSRSHPAAASGESSKTCKAVRVAAVLTLPWGKKSLKRTLTQLRALGPSPDFRVARNFLEEAQPSGPRRRAAPQANPEEAAPVAPSNASSAVESSSSGSRAAGESSSSGNGSGSAVGTATGTAEPAEEIEETGSGQEGEEEEDSEDDDALGEELLAARLRMVADGVGLDFDGESSAEEDQEAAGDGQPEIGDSSDSDVEENFRGSACVAIDLIESGCDSDPPGLALAAWVSRPMQFCQSAPLRRCVGPSDKPAIYAIISFILGPGPGGLDHDAVAVIEMDESSGEVLRTFELPQFCLRPIVCWQWLGPLLAIVEPCGSEAGTLHIFCFDFGEDSENIGIYEAFRLATSRGACLPLVSSASNSATSSSTCFGLSGLWRVNGHFEGQSYRYHLRIEHNSADGTLKGGGRSMALEGKAVKEEDGCWTAEFNQLHDGDPTGICRATLPVGSEELRGQWRDSESKHEGIFTARKETSGMHGCNRKRQLEAYSQDWASSGHRFALKIAGARGVVLCEWPEPFAFCNSEP